MKEEEAIRSILDLFTMLFGADRVAYVSVGGDKPGVIYSKHQAPDDAIWIQSWIDRIKPCDAYAATGAGFCVRVNYQNEPLGILIADTIALPRHGQDCLDLALGMAGLCGLAVTNARSIGRCQRAEEELARKSGELARANADLDQFAYIASHDLHAPLGMIGTLCKLLCDECASTMNDLGREYVVAIQSSVQRMQRLTKGFLSYSRIKNNGKAFAVIPLSSPVQKAVEDLAKCVEETGAKVEIGVLPTVRGDELQLYQLFQNLISNALKFVPKGRAPCVYVSSRSFENGKVEISVKDNGVGFYEKDLGRIFQPFQCLHPEQEYPVSGIGLAICRKIVQLHGGEITASSRPDEGTTFLLTLPEYLPEHGE